MGSHQHPQDVANLADDFPSPEPTNAHLETMDMSSELANQAAAQAIEHAVAVAASASAEASTSATGSHVHTQAHTHEHADESEHGLVQGQAQGHHLPDSSSLSPHVSRHASPSLASITYRAQQEAQQQQHQHHLQQAQHQQQQQMEMSNSEQLVILRESYARNPNPDRKELDRLAERTGRPWNKIREYFRQRRNKLRGLRDLERMEEPGRASGWLQVTYRVGPETSSVSQLNLYNSYRTRFDPYASHAPLLGGQELIQLVCATFPGCEMAKDSDDYVMKGLKLRDGAAATEGEQWEKGVDGLVEPLRASTWLLSNFQQQSPDTLSQAPNLTQTDLYTTYAARFSTILPAENQVQASADEAELREYEAEMAAPDTSNGIDENDIHSFSLALSGQQDQPDDSTPVPQPQPKREERLLNPVELINLTRMTFPKSEPAVDEQGRFIIRGLERREGVEKGRNVKVDEMFPFALASAPSASDPNHPFTSLLKRKLGMLHPDPDSSDTKRAKRDPGAEQLQAEEKELVQGLKRFRDSPLGKEVRDTCVQQ